MLPSSHPLAKKPKIYFSHGILPKTIHLENAPAAYKPFSTTLQNKWVHKVELILTLRLYELLEATISGCLPTPSYYVVTFPLLVLLKSDFLHTSIRTGSPISLISHPEPGPESIQYSLFSEKLCLELPKDIYERIGLVGRPIVSPGTNPHLRRRFRVEQDLRSLIMSKSNKGFERLCRACREVLTESVTWLIHHQSTISLAPPTLEAGAGEPVSKPSRDLDPEFPTYEVKSYKVRPEVTRLHQIHVPRLVLLDSTSGEEDPDEAMDLLDWLGSISIGSQRLAAADGIDSFLSRWKVPNPDTASIGDVVRIQWKGFLSGEWVRALLLSVMRDTRTKRDAWFAISARRFSSDVESNGERHCGYTILRTQLEELEESVDTKEKGEDTGREPPVQAEFLLWEVVDALNH